MNLFIFFRFHDIPLTFATVSLFVCLSALTVKLQIPILAYHLFFFSLGLRPLLLRVRVASGPTIALGTSDPYFSLSLGSFPFCPAASDGSALSHKRESLSLLCRRRALKSTIHRIISSFSFCVGPPFFCRKCLLYPRPGLVLRPPFLLIFFFVSASLSAELNRECGKLLCPFTLTMVIRE